MKLLTTTGIVVVLLLIVSCGNGREDPAPPPAAATKRPAEAALGDTDRDRPAGTERANEVESADADEKSAVEIPPDVQRRLGIEVATAAESHITVPLQVTGSIQPIDTRIARVRPLARGRIVDVRVNVGDRVNRGQELASFDNIEAGELASQYQSAQADLARLHVQLATATRQAERSRRLAEIGAVPQRESEASLGEQQQVEASVRAQESLIRGLEARQRRFGSDRVGDGDSITSIRSPFGGLVTAVKTAPGDVVEQAQELFAIADISRVYVQAQVFERDLGRVQKNQTATIAVDAYPDQHFVGRVVAIGDVVDANTRTVAVRCEVPNPEGRLKLDMFARVALPTTATEAQLAVPSEAVQNLAGKPVVFVQSNPSTFSVRPVNPGPVTGALTAIHSGLKAGERVAARGAFKVKSAMLAGALGDDDEKEKE